MPSGPSRVSGWRFGAVLDRRRGGRQRPGCGPPPGFRQGKPRMGGDGASELLASHEFQAILTGLLRTLEAFPDARAAAADDLSRLTLKPGL